MYKTHDVARDLTHTWLVLSHVYTTPTAQRRELKSFQVSERKTSGSAYTINRLAQNSRDFMEREPLLQSRRTMQASHKIGYLIPILSTVVALVILFVFNGLAANGPNGKLKINYANLFLGSQLC